MADTKSKTKLFMKQQFVLTPPTLKHVMFLQKEKDKRFFFWTQHLTEGVFVTQLYINVGISDR
jgi:hypothetical protein